MWRLLLAFKLALFCFMADAGYVNQQQYNYQPNNYGYQPVKSYGKPKECYDNSDYHPRGYGSYKGLKQQYTNYPPQGPAYNTYGYEQPVQNNYGYASQGGYDAQPKSYSPHSTNQDYTSYGQPAPEYYGYEQHAKDNNYGYQQQQRVEYEYAKPKPTYELHQYGPTKVTVEDSFPVNYVGAKTDYEVDLTDVILPLPSHKHKKHQYPAVPVQKNYVDYKPSKEAYPHNYKQQDYDHQPQHVSAEEGYGHQEAEPQVPYSADEQQNHENHGEVAYQEEQKPGYSHENHEQQHSREVDIPSNYEEPSPAYSPPHPEENYNQEQEEKPDYNQPPQPSEYNSNDNEPVHNQRGPQSGEYNKPAEQPVQVPPPQIPSLTTTPSPQDPGAPIPTSTSSATPTSTDTPLSSKNKEIVTEHNNQQLDLQQQQQQQNPDLLEQEQEQNLQSDKPLIPEPPPTGPNGIVLCEEKISIEQCSAFFTCKHAGGATSIGSCWQKGVETVFDGTTQSCLKPEALPECNRDNFCAGGARGWKLMDAKKCTKKAFFCDNEAEDHTCDQMMVIDPTDPSSCVRENTVPDCTPFLSQAKATD